MLECTLFLSSDAMEITSDAMKITSEAMKITSDAMKITSDAMKITSDAMEIEQKNPRKKERKKISSIACLASLFAQDHVK